MFPKTICNLFNASHHIGLVHDLGVETSHADIVAVVAVLVVEVSRNGLHGLEVRNERVPCTRRDERLSECRSVIEVTSVRIDSVAACKVILKTELCRVCEEFRSSRLAL